MATFEELKTDFEKGDVRKRMSAISGLLVMLGVNAEDATKFVDANIQFLGQELRVTGFALNNVFMQFLSVYAKSNRGSIKEFIVPEN